MDLFVHDPPLPMPPEQVKKDHTKLKKRNPTKAAELTKNFYQNRNWDFQAFRQALVTTIRSEAIRKTYAVQKLKKTDFIRHMRAGGITDDVKIKKYWKRGTDEHGKKLKQSLEDGETVLEMPIPTTINREEKFERSCAAPDKTRLSKNQHERLKGGRRCLLRHCDASTLGWANTKLGSGGSESEEDEGDEDDDDDVCDDEEAAEEETEEEEGDDEPEEDIDSDDGGESDDCDSDTGAKGSMPPPMKKPASSTSHLGTSPKLTAGSIGSLAVREVTPPKKSSVRAPSISATSDVGSEMGFGPARKRQRTKGRPDVAYQSVEELMASLESAPETVKAPLLLWSLTETTIALVQHTLNEAKVWRGWGVG